MSLVRAALLAAPLLALWCAAASAAPEGARRAPAAPLLATDPYFSVWSCTDALTGGETSHWTGAAQPLHSLIRVDGAAYRLMGSETADLPAMRQTACVVTPTRTTYRFAGAGVAVELSFLTPMLPDDLDQLSRSLGYITWKVNATDGRKHAVAVYFDAGAELAVNTPDQPVRWQRVRPGGVPALCVGTVEQPVLAKRGDNLRIDWGRLYLAPLPGQSAKLGAASGDLMRRSFAGSGALPADDAGAPRPVKEGGVALATAIPLGSVASAPVSRTVLVAYDDGLCIRYFENDLKPYWARNGAGAAQLIKSAIADLPALEKRCADLDRELTADFKRVGGADFAWIATLAYRQAFAGNKLAADPAGQPLFFPKENFSNGCIATVDILYPMGPQFLLFGPATARAMLQPVMDYSASNRWKWPFAPHDLGTYPHATAQVYGGGERTEENQMPVEESGNLLILMAALAKMEGNADYATHFWPTLTRWAEYLRDKGLDPENQLCTDDFAGHLAHNANLSAKAIVALGAYGMLAGMRGDAATAARYTDLAKGFASRWREMAEDGGHTRLAFDKPGTWSQKYNIVWDRILGLGLFPAELGRSEVAYYRSILNRYGLPLDNRQPYTKLDWTIWSATLTGNREDFDALVKPLADMLQETTDRVPMTDWYWTQNAKKVGFQARPVVGGALLPLLYDEALWKKWASRNPSRPTGYAPLPERLELTVVIPTGREATWRYTTQQPAAGWQQPRFADEAWQTGKGGFGTQGTPGAVIGTEWSTGDIWLRREFEWPAGVSGALGLLVHHDEDAEISIDGVKAAALTGYVSDYVTVPVSKAAQAALTPGRHVLAVHCRQTTGGQFIDVGIGVSKKK
ncbi:MAG: DUF4965 domain-containing protein [Armatimonadetes bacterium]|nr:DUF4965 domain-containing protein [Armatimonadota bacterium]